MYRVQLITTRKKKSNIIKFFNFRMQVDARFLIPLSALGSNSTDEICLFISTISSKITGNIEHNICYAEL